MEKPEFAVGDKVTFAPYHFKYDMYVVGYQTSIDGFTLLYKLASKRYYKNYSTLTSGKCIAESKRYKP